MFFDLQIITISAVHCSNTWNTFFAERASFRHSGRGPRPRTLALRASQRCVYRVLIARVIIVVVNIFVSKKGIASFRLKRGALRCRVSRVPNRPVSGFKWAPGTVHVQAPLRGGGVSDEFWCTVVGECGLLCSSAYVPWCGPVKHTSTTTPKWVTSCKLPPSPEGSLKFGSRFQQLSGLRQCCRPLNVLVRGWAPLGFRPSSKIDRTEHKQLSEDLLALLAAITSIKHVVVRAPFAANYQISLRIKGGGWDMCREVRDALIT